MSVSCEPICLIVGGGLVVGREKDGAAVEEVGDPEVGGELNIFYFYFQN